MLWTPHFIIGIITSCLLFPFYGWNVLIILISNILIDADHYLWYVFGMKSFNLPEAFKFYKNRKLRLRYKNILHIFHTSEILIFLIILSFFNEFFLLVLIGVVIHLILDVIDLISKGYLELRAWSFFGWFLFKIKRFL